MNSKEKLKKLKVKSGKSKKKSTCKLNKIFHKNTSKSSTPLDIQTTKQTIVDFPKTYSTNDSIDEEKFNQDRLLLEKAITGIIGNTKEPDIAFELVQKNSTEVIEIKNKSLNENQASLKQPNNILKEMDSNKIFQKTASKSIENSPAHSKKPKTYFPKTQSEMDTSEENQFNLDCQRIGQEIQEVLKHLKNHKPLPAAEESCSDAFDCGSNG